MKEGAVLTRTVGRMYIALCFGQSHFGDEGRGP